MPYTSFRFIAYEVPTATNIYGPPVVSGFDAGLDCAAVARIPVDDNTPADARARLRRLAAVVDRAATTLVEKTQYQKALRDKPDTLKIFMAPEFYFRPPLKANPTEYINETYSYDDAVKIFEELNVMFRHADFKDWLIIPGTVMWNWKDDQAPQGRLYRNSALYIRGNKEEGLRLVEKAVPSRIDGVPNPFDDPAKLYDPHFQEVFEHWHLRKDRVFEIDGIWCGLEVCLDHGSRRVLKTVLSNWSTYESAPCPDLCFHLLPAGGMPLVPRSIAAKENGYILRNDGLDGDNPHHSELYQVRRYIDGEGQQAKKIYPSDLAGTAELNLYGARSEREVKLVGNELVPMFGNGYREFPQRLVFYERQGL